jgi:hypothetical protein
MAPLRQPLLAELQRGEHEEVRMLVEAGLPHPDPIHDPVPKSQLLRQRVSTGRLMAADGGRRSRPRTRTR